jgi:hypothetical protein
MVGKEFSRESHTVKGLVSDIREERESKGAPKAAKKINYQYVGL